MFRIRRVVDDTAPQNQRAIAEAQAIFRAGFPTAHPHSIDGLPERLRNPLRSRLRTLLFVAEDAADRILGAAILLYAPDLGFCFLDFIAANPNRPRRGIGGALYDRVRDEALALGTRGLFLECVVDDPTIVRDPAALKQNQLRLKFYERYGARPVVGTAYEEPLSKTDIEPMFLVFDPLGGNEMPSRANARGIVRAYLERRYPSIMSPAQIARVVASFRDDPIRLRAPRHVRAEPQRLPPAPPTATQGITLVVSARHELHHMRERGYVEAPVRIRAILPELERMGHFRRVPSRPFPESAIRSVHDGVFVDYLRRACANVAPGSSIYPEVFPIRNRTRPPKSLPLRAGYFCIDTFTPLNANAYIAARDAVDCTLTAAEAVLAGDRLAYALVRPPGHHAESRAFGGWCYFNNAAIAAHRLSRYGRVAMLDIDYHHGNGTQEIFYRRDDVLTVSIHCHPRHAYPHFAGFGDERGEGPGRGYNLNIPLPEVITPAQYQRALAAALSRIARYRPAYLVISLGFDTAQGDPTGTWPNRTGDFGRIGRTIGAAGYPTLIVQEGGYRTRTLGANARHFFDGLATGVADARASRRKSPQA